MLKTFTPIPLQVNPSTCTAWFDFSDTSSANIQASGSDIVSVLNKAGNGNNLSQGVSANRPKTGTRTQNGLNVAAFDGTNDFLKFNSNTPLSAPFTVFFVGKIDEEARQGSFFGRQTSTTAGQIVCGKNASFSFFQSFCFGTAGAVSDARPTSNLNPNIHCLTFANGDRLRHGLNGLLNFSGNIISGYDNAVATPLCLGTSNVGGSSPLLGFIGEFITYSSVLNSSQVAAVSGYLSRKWGIALA